MTVLLVIAFFGLVLINDHLAGTAVADDRSLDRCIGDHGIADLHELLAIAGERLSRLLEVEVDPVDVLLEHLHGDARDGVRFVQRRRDAHVCRGLDDGP